MKRTLSTIALVAICCAMMVSCKNKTNEPTPEEIQAQKVALADTVLAKIDALAEQFQDQSDKSFSLYKFVLTDNEKLVKPDYLLDPSAANNLVTKSQKINALAIYIMENGIRSIYDMPKEEFNEVIAKLCLEVSSFDFSECFQNKTKYSEIAKDAYQKAKENNELGFFWELHLAMLEEASYILANNIDLFFSKISEDQWKSFSDEYGTIYHAIEELAQYDDEMAEVLDNYQQTMIFDSEEDTLAAYKNIETSKKTFSDNKDKYIAKRNSMLQ